MKNHLFCVGAAVGPSAAQGVLAAHVNLYVGANDLREALARVEAALACDGYPLIFVRGCWVVDAACNDGFCPVDELPGEVGGGLLFSISETVSISLVKRLIRSPDWCRS